MHFWIAILFNVVSWHYNKYCIQAHAGYKSDSPFWVSSTLAFLMHPGHLWHGRLCDMNWPISYLESNDIMYNAFVSTWLCKQSIFSFSFLMNLNVTLLDLSDNPSTRGRGAAVGGSGSGWNALHIPCQTVISRGQKNIQKRNLHLLQHSLQKLIILILGTDTPHQA